MIKPKKNNFYWGESRLPDELILDEYTEKAHDVWIKMINKTWNLNRLNPGFWFTHFSSRNPFSCSLLYDLSMLLCINENSESFRDYVFISQNEQQCSVLRKILTGFKVEPPEYSKKGKLGKLAEGLRFRIRFILDLMRRIKEYLLGTTIDILKQKGQAPAKIKLKNQASRKLMFIDTYVSMNSNGKLDKDRYFQGLGQKIISDDRFVDYWLYTPVSNLTPAFYKAMDHDARKWLHKDSYLKWRDYFFPLLFPILCTFMQLPANIEGLPHIKIKSLLRYHIRKGQYDKMCIYGMLCKRFIKRLVAQGMRPDYFLDWFENQWMDRGLHQGFSKYSQTTFRIGYQPWHPVHSFYNPYTTDLESAAGVIPQALANFMTANHTFQRYRSSHLPTVSIPAFRNEAVASLQTFKPGVKQKDRRYGLVVLPLIDQSMKYIFKRIKSVLTSEDRVRPHPMHTDADLNNIMQSLGIESEALDQSASFIESVQQASYCISNASTSALEVLACGTPLIVLADRSQINYHPIPDALLGECCHICYSAEEFQVSLIKMRSFWKNTENHKAMQAVQQRVLKEFFPAPDKNSYQTFISAIQILKNQKLKNQDHEN